MEKMSHKTDLMLRSQYIIDGVRYDVPPVAMLNEDVDTAGEENDIVDESREPSLGLAKYDSRHIPDYIRTASQAAKSVRPFNMAYPEHFSRLAVATALTDTLWRDGHVKLGNLNIRLQWDWNDAPVGNMSAFYRSVESVSEYLYDLGVKIGSYQVTESNGESIFSAEAFLGEGHLKDDEPEEDPLFLFKSSPYESSHPHLSEQRKCLESICPREEDWIVFVPFDPCRFTLGGSLFAEMEGCSADVAPNISDPDYFIDCYEVIREMVEDGIIVAGRRVGRGGIAVSLQEMASCCGADVDFRGLMGSYQENDPVKVLFGEVPGVIVEIEDENFDYFDSQMLLQDVAYYPLGHPAPGHEGLVFASNAAVTDILASLINPASEGED